MENKTLTFIITAMLALSGWGTLLYTWLTSDPVIEGRALNIVSATWYNPQFNGKPKTILMPYLYLINKRKNPVHVLDYELEFDVGHGFVKADRVYGINESFPSDFDKPSNDIYIPDFTKKLIYAKNLPVEYGAPLHGFAVFASDMPASELQGNIKKIKITCVDAFNNRHVTITTQDKFSNLYLLQDIAGIQTKRRQ